MEIVLVRHGEPEWVRDGLNVVDPPLTPADVACTVYESLGINPQKQLFTPDGRPVKILDKGETVRELFA